MTRKLTVEDRLANQTPAQRLENQLILGQCRIGAEAAREIARRITGQHGFWDFEERKRAAQVRAENRVITLRSTGYATQQAA